MKLRSSTHAQRGAVAAFALAHALLGSGCSGVVEQAESDAIARTAGQCAADGALDGESQRLDAFEMQATVDSLLGFHVDLGEGFPSALHVHSGYSTYPEANRISYRDVARIADAADAAGVAAIDHLDDLLPCAASAIDSSCVRRFVDDFARRAFRGTYDASDGDRLVALYDSLVGGPTPLERPVAVAAVISAVLQSPGVLYLVERGTTVSSERRRLRGEEIANRMSYLFWDAPPDDALLEAAAAGELDSAAGRRAQAERLLGDPRARAPVVRFFREWMELRPELYVDRASPAVVAALEEELRRYVEHAVFEAGADGLETLMTSPQTFVNRSLALHYGATPVPPDDATWAVATLPAGGGGLLARGAVAGSNAEDGATSIVKRGRFARERLLCGTLGIPPANVIARNPTLPPTATVRERSEARAAIAGCYVCHQWMDPIGIGMEDIDQIGRFRSIYTDSGYDVDARGEILHSSNVPPTIFDGTAQLSSSLVESEAFRECLPRQWFRFAMGRALGDACNSDTMTKRLEESGGDLREMLLSIVESQGFVLRADEGL